MLSLNVQYTSHLRKLSGYSATWIPSTGVRLGDVCKLMGYQYERMCTLKDFGVDITLRKDTNKGYLDYSTSDSLTISLKAAGEVPSATSALAEIDAGIKVSFGSYGSLLFQASNCKVASITNLHLLGKKLLSFYEEGRWPNDYVVVTEVIHADRASILISNSTNASIELKTRADIHLNEQSLVDADAAFQVVKSHNIGMQIVAQGDITPLFKVFGVRKRLFQKPELVRKGASDKEEKALSRTVYFGEVDYDYFE